MSRRLTTHASPPSGPPIALFDASHGQKRWAQTGFPSREMHTNFSGVTEALCRRGLDCRSTGDAPLAKQLAQSSFLVLPPPTGRYDPRTESWRHDPTGLLAAEEVAAILDFLQAGGSLLAFG